ncbi:MAG: lysophospholipid acyltransferase family protein [Alphaproteobacteria bacterium]|nr:lysophospholipid acyltransferase family protein [Alphaproteobacteria bacterium]
MKRIKKLTRLPSVQKGLAWLFASYIKMVYRTSSFEYRGHDHLDILIKNGIPVIVAFWHGRLAMLPCAWQWERPFHMLLSKHRDGMLISRVLEHFSIHSIFGSSTRGGVEASLQILDKIREGAVIGITPDGPRGPAQQCSMGIITLAKLAAKDVGDVHIIPGSYSIKRHKRLRSWDTFMVPFPFSQGVFIAGEPVIIRAGMNEDELESMRIRLEEYLNTVQREADAFFQ